MALGKRYYREFYSIKGDIWRIEILQEGFDASKASSVDVVDSEPLIIEWYETDKLEPVQGSAATLTLFSDTDRRFVDLYTVETGSIRLDVYLNGSIYWSGALDTELYEEPYSTEKGYEVRLTFADLACLDRMDWAGTGLIPIGTVLENCITASGIKHAGIDTSMISTNVNLSTHCVLNGLYGAKEGTVVDWDGDDSVLSADKVYNNVRVTFSPYGDAEMMKGTVSENAELTSASGGYLVYMNYERNSYGTAVVALQGFRFHYRDKQQGDITMESNMELSGGAKYFQICSIFSGSDENGVAATFKQGDYPVSIDGNANSQCKHMILTPRNCGTIAAGNVSSAPLITCPKSFLGYVSYTKNDYMLRINLQLLFDVRYNPFEQEGDYNDNASYKDGFLNLNSHDGPYQHMQDWCNFGYVPIKLYLVDGAGTVLYHYENYKVLESNGYDQSGKASWKAGAPSWGQAWLCYYDFDDRKSKTGFGGWKSNKPMIGYYRDSLPEKWKSLDDGEYIPLPPVGGYLVMEIGSGIHQFDYKREVKDIYKYCRWILYKEPAITLCKKNYTEAETDDVEDSAWLNRSAKEEMSIDTVVGTLPVRMGVPNAKGQIFDKSGGIVTSYTRKGVSDRLERLLIGTVYSQYATRHNVLSGTVKLLPGFDVYTYGATPGKFILLSELQDCRADTSEIKMSELSEDNYQGIEYK